MDNGSLVSEHSGFPNPATDANIRGLDLNKLLVKHPSSTFFMQIEGSTWEDRNLFDKDVVLIDRALAPRKTDLVIWNEEATFRLGRLGDMPKDIELWGVITTVIHVVRK